MSEALTITNQEIVGAPEGRSKEVLVEIKRIRGHLHEGLFDLAELLAEARKNGYHLNWGYGKFGEWVEQASGLDMSERTAYYLISIIEKSKLLDIPREQLRAAKMSKLKEIFTLGTEEHGEQMKRLVQNSEDFTLPEIRAAVQTIKSGDGIEPFVFMTLKVPKSVKDETVDQAFELVRKQYGDVRDDQGNIIDLTDGKCLEYVCASYVQDPNNLGEQP